MSKDELSRLVNDVMSNPAMLSEAMTLTDQASMETYINSKGYGLSRDEMLEVWTMAAKVLAGHTMAMAEANRRIETVKSEVLAAQG